MLDPIRVQSRSAGQHWPEAGRMILAHWLASGPDPFGQNLTQSPKPDTVTKTRHSHQNLTQSPKPDTVTKTQSPKPDTVTKT